ncbi:MAG: TetR/AcrR family transcriptional regulator [Hyphomicrobiales bacterium]|nr:TetR/AcrR family transcriptional regulator [Hyphomicrobiales bacterium]MDE1972149.1 TetR/AcrR family transcriptional regulator [Hyphomicrobiales bacterium]MDE2283406.1 TetR/AcrR family transcriptional regulator [Hyphomicrobiales bacterium]
MTDVLETHTETRRRRKAERPHEILEAAFLEFSRNGYAMTTLDAIAERAGVTKGTIYVYFENKEHLFISMVRELMKVTLDTVHDMFERHEGSTADLLKAQFSFIYENIVEDRRRREVVRMLIAEAPRFPALADRYHDEIHQPCMEMLQHAIQRGMDRGEIKRSAITECALVIVAPMALIDVWMMMFEDRQPIDLKAYFNAHLDLVLKGLLTKS